jgi:hypothetical protein
MHLCETTGQVQGPRLGRRAMPRLWLGHAQRVARADKLPTLSARQVQHERVGPLRHLPARKVHREPGFFMQRLHSRQLLGLTRLGLLPLQVWVVVVCCLLWAYTTDGIYVYFEFDLPRRVCSSSAGQESQKNSGSTGCTFCSAGTYNPSQGSMCKLCQPGTKSAAYQKSTSTLCPFHCHFVC